LSDGYEQTCPGADPNHSRDRRGGGRHHEFLYAVVQGTHAGGGDRLRHPQNTRLRGP